MKSEVMGRARKEGARSRSVFMFKNFGVGCVG